MAMQQQQGQQQNGGVVRRVRRRSSRGEVSSSSREGAEERLGDGGGGEDGVGVVEFRPRSSPLPSSERGEGMAARRRAGRECPVAKPGGILGEWLGFHGGTGSAGGGDGGGKEGGEKTRPVR